MTNQNKNTNIIWIDLEMTGLDTDQDKIIEIATIVTDAQLNIIAEGPDLVIHQSDTILNQMDEWNIRQHTHSGLLTSVRASYLTEKQAEEITLNFLKEHTIEGKSPMAGNSICQDRRFLYRNMPTLERYFHYRNLDVSTIKELAMRWMPSILENIKKESQHRALDDIRDSIQELLFYRKNFFHPDSRNDKPSFFREF